MSGATATDIIAGAAAPAIVDYARESPAMPACTTGTGMSWTMKMRFRSGMPRSCPPAWNMMNEAGYMAYLYVPVFKNTFMLMFPLLADQIPAIIIENSDPPPWISEN
jgi:hypothetical protein